MPGAIYAEGLVKTFGDVRALDGVDLDVPEGTVLGLLGPNGAGKTTTVRCLTTLLRPDSGRAVVAGVDVLKHPNEVRRSIGLSGQFAAVDEYLTGRENLQMVGQLYQMRAGFGKGETTVEEHTRKLTVPVTGGAKLLAEVIRELDARGIEMDDVGLRRPTLDDVFLSLTGHVAEVEAEENGTTADTKDRKHKKEAVK